MSKYFDNKKLFDMPQVLQHGSHMVMKDGGGSCDRKLYVNFDTRFSNDVVSGLGSGDADYNLTSEASASSAKYLRCSRLSSSASYNFVLPVFHLTPAAPTPRQNRRQSKYQQTGAAWLRHRLQRQRRKASIRPRHHLESPPLS